MSACERDKYMSKHRNELDHTHILFSFSSSLQTELLLCAKSRDV